MPRWLIILAAGASMMLLAFVASSAGAYNIAMLLLFAGFVALVVAILYRPREIRARDNSRVFGAAGAGWGSGIGPVPGEEGESVPRELLPYSLTRLYRARSRDTLERLRITDSNLLAGRGYVPTSSQYLEGQWRGVDWLAALLMLLLLLIVGIVALIYMALNKPTGTLTVTYERRAPDVAQVTGAPALPAPALHPSL